MKPQVFILHYAGGNVYSFQALVGKLRPLFAVEPLELPGRGRRIKETLLHTKKDAVADYLRQIKAKRTGAPFLIFGHSMGATLGFNIVKALEAAGDAPVCFIASGNSGPNIKEPKNYSQLPQDEFFAALTKMGGITQELSGNLELLEFFEPIIRADFALLEKAEEPINYKISTPICAVMGSHEEYVEDIANWEKYTTGNFQQLVLEGNHFFVFDYIERLQQLIKKSFLPQHTINK